MTKNTKKETKMEKKQTKNTKKEAKMEENSKKTVKMVKKSNKKQVKTTKKEAKMIKNQKDAEKVIKKVAKSFKIKPERIKIKKGAKGIGAFRLKKDGFVRIAARTNDIVVYSPTSVTKAGKVGPRGYEHITIFKYGTATESVLEEAFRNALKDKFSPIQWKVKLGATGRRSKPKTIQEIIARRKRLEAEIKALKAVERKEKAKNTKKVKKTPKAKAIAAVAEA